MENFKQLCVWPGTIVGQDSIEEFESVMEKEFGVRVKYAEEVITNPDPGETIEQSGGRTDLFFWLHDDDVNKWAIQRLQLGIRWWEDVISYNDNSYLYPQEVIDRYPVTW